METRCSGQRPICARPECVTPPGDCVDGGWLGGWSRRVGLSGQAVPEDLHPAVGQGPKIGVAGHRRSLWHQQQATADRCRVGAVHDAPEPHGVSGAVLSRVTHHRARQSRVACVDLLVLELAAGSLGLGDQGADLVGVAGQLGKGRAELVEGGAVAAVGAELPPSDSRSKRPARSGKLDCMSHWVRPSQKYPFGSWPRSSTAASAG